MSSFVFVSDPAALAALLERLAKVPSLAFDTEFVRERTYYPQLCLIQVASADDIACIDPLAIKDLAALEMLLARSAGRKVVHAVRQDLEALLTRFSQVPSNVFDTQVAASLIGLPPQIGYGDLVQRMLGVSLEKGHARTDWAMRPLSDAQLTYAADDVRYLLPLQDVLVRELERLGRLAWFVEEMIRHVAAGSKRADPLEAWQRLKGLEGLDARRLATAKALAQWREQRAMERDRPRGWILADDAVYDIARELPEDRVELARIRSLPPGVVERSGSDLVAAVRSTAHLENGAEGPRQRYRPDPQLQARLKGLSATVRKIAEQLQLSPELLATRRDLQQLLAGNTDIEPLRGWRRAVVGEALLKAL